MKKMLMTICLIVSAVILSGCGAEYGASFGSGVAAMKIMSDVAAIESLKGREKDPVMWIALASLLANAFVGGKYIGKP